MTVFFQDNLRTIYHGDSRDMTELKDESIQCCVTSPPYWGLRKYDGCPDLIWGGTPDCQHVWGEENIHSKGYAGEKSTLVGTQTADIAKQSTSTGSYCSLCGAWRGQFGLEPTIELYVEHTLVFLKEIWRVLRKDGVLFWNIGDSYFGSGQGYGDTKTTNKNHTGSRERQKPEWNDSTLKPKDLCLIPFRVALAVQAAGWWVRSAIIWNKPNPMPESVTDRPTNAYEHIFLFTKSARYFWDIEAVREAANPDTQRNKPVNSCVADGNVFNGDRRQNYEKERHIVANRNLRDVWTFPTKGYSGAHFAVFPPELPERCIKAGTPEHGCCDKCGRPYERIVEKYNNAESWKGSKFDDGKNLEIHPNVGRREDAHTNGGKDANSNRIALLRQAARENGGEYINETKTLGWQQACKCENSNPVPSTVLDPFSGSGTTLLVAAKLGRKAIGYELSDKYCDLNRARNGQGVII